MNKQSVVKNSDNKKRNNIINAVFGALFGLATVATFFFDENMPKDFFGWFNMTRLSVYALFIVFLVRIFLSGFTPKTKSDLSGQRYKKWVKNLVIILPILAVIFAIINAAFPEFGAMLVRMDTTNGWQRPAIFVKIVFELVACSVFISTIPHFAHHKKWLSTTASILCALVLFVMAGEEISWGQRLFQWETTGFFAENNIQGETNLHNLATQLFQNVLYFGGFILLIVLPFFQRAIAKLFNKTRALKSLITFLPDQWMILAFGAGLVFIDPFVAYYGWHWGSICFQMIATIVFLATLVALYCKSDNKFFVHSAIRSFLCALIVITLSLVFDGLWRYKSGAPTEYIEVFINFGILCWALGIKNKTKTQKKSFLPVD
jgi:hypothetical protein